MAALYSTSEFSIPCAGGQICFLRTGSGSPMLLLHGIGSSATSWRAQLQGLSGQYDVIAWNAPGYGASTALTADAPDTADYAEKLLALLDALSIDTCHLVGHSLGSLIAARFARLHGERLKTLSLASCAIGHARLEPDERQRLLDNRLDDVRDLGMAAMATKRGPRLLTPDASAAMVGEVIRNMAQANPGGYAQAARMLSAGDMLSDIAAIDPDLPIQVIYGEQDIITPPQANERAAAARDGITRLAIPAAGHLVYVEQPQAFNAAIVDFARTRHFRSTRHGQG